MGLQEDVLFAEETYDEEKVRISTALARSQASQNSGFVFVNFDQDDREKQKQDSRKIVRSRATTYSHRVAPRGAVKHDRNLRTLRSAGEDIGPSERSSTASYLNSPSPAVSSLKRPLLSSPESSHADPAAPTVSLANVSRKRVARIPAVNFDVPSSSRDESLSPGCFEVALPDPHAMDASSRDPFSTYPVQFRAWYSKLLNFWYNVVFKRSTGVLKASEHEIAAYTIWSRRQEMSEPVLFYTSLFLASGIPVAEVEAMKSALNDPVRALSIPVILAVGRIALHEHIYGDRRVAHNVHRPAQRRMIEMRGGLANLGIPHTTIQLIVWSDALMSGQTGTEPFFADLPRQIRINSYTAQEAATVTNTCSPHRAAHPGYGT